MLYLWGQDNCMQWRDVKLHLSFSPNMEMNILKEREKAFWPRMVLKYLVAQVCKCGPH